MEMENAFKQLMQQQGGNSEFVTLAMTSGKGLELVSDPSQVGAIMQAAASMEAQTGPMDESQEVTEQNLSVAVIAEQVETRQEEAELAASKCETSNAATLTLSGTQGETDNVPVQSNIIDSLSINVSMNS